ncbi:MazG-like nucleotide pyrophosphohydrolase [Gordonia phage LittleFella]|nr:MazG-like nucleotide pyrophosphohydrolase [Gordonia phage LittleFella]
MDLLGGVHQFMEIGGQLAPEKSGENTDQILRIELLKEETMEYLKGIRDRNLVEEVDGLVDILVIAAGSLISRVGLRAARTCLNEVLYSNLSKFEEDENGVPRAILREDGKILKGKDYWAPQIAEVLKAEGLL